jgi:hypothetical protein
MQQIKNHHRKSQLEQGLNRALNHFPTHRRSTRGQKSAIAQLLDGRPGDLTQQNQNKIKIEAN